ncbi:MAG: class I SAM-dependent methyltransferase [Burkholderiaceae bacterium]|nr:class I SAM-dependent methyltransferase [Burkholderiaceae bacterium]
MTKSRCRRDLFRACRAAAAVALGLFASMPAARAADPASASASAIQDDRGGRLPPADNRAPPNDNRPPPGSDPAARAALRVATSDPLVTRMLHLAQIDESDTLVDLGSGDGRIAIAAAREFGARARGIDSDPNLVELARRNAEQAGVSGRVTFEQGDLLSADLSSATVVTMYLTQEITLRLRSALLATRPGTRVVSREFRMGDWEPEESSRIGLRSMYLWVVPANAGGDWKLQLQQSSGPIDAMLRIRQRFQMLDGRVSLAGVETTMREARMLGDQVHFAFTDTDGALRIVDARIEPGRMIGAVATRDGDVAPFLAERVGEAPPIEGMPAGATSAPGAAGAPGAAHAPRAAGAAGADAAGAAANR